MNRTTAWFQEIRATGKRHRVFRLFFFISVAASLFSFMDLGFGASGTWAKVVPWLFFLIHLTGGLGIALRYLAGPTRRKGVWVFDAVVALLQIACMRLIVLQALDAGVWTDSPAQQLSHLGVWAVFVREWSVQNIDYRKIALNPAQLLVLSFSGLILAGALLLMLPRASHTSISFLDALFTSASAVCVTGLIVVDTGTFFTPLGQGIILALIQLGGLGIMTFATYFSLFFLGNTSFSSQLVAGDISSTSKLSEVIGTVRKIVTVTLLIELAGAIAIFFSLRPGQFATSLDKAYFALFHSISAFCNAGFSTLRDSLYQTGFRDNYPLLVIVAALLMAGGLGFPIVFNLIRYGRYLLERVFLGRERTYQPWIVNLNSRLILITTAALVLIGWAGYFALEYHHTLAEHSGGGKVVAAFFAGVTPRTAGFNNVDLTTLRGPAAMLILFLMWVGASPASTGGGIKTSTLALAVLNVMSFARGQNRVEVFRREVAFSSLQRAFSIIALSVVALFAGIFAVASFNPELDLLKVVFECISAYSTVGLSMGITASLSAASKWVIIALMLIGRVGSLTLLVALVRKSPFKNYRYSTEEILIN
jgi:potassium uptake TrkH family protein